MLFLTVFVAGGLLLPELHRVGHLQTDQLCEHEGVGFIDGDRHEIHECELCDVRLIGIVQIAPDVCHSVVSIREQPIVAESFDTIVVRSYDGRAPPAIG